MAFLAGIFGMLGRFAGKILTTTLGWASSLLFGRVPQDRQIVLALITFGSIVWAALVVGVLLPEIGAFLVAAVPAPDVVDRGWLRLAMLIGALVVPAAIGVATLFVMAPADRPTGTGIVGQVLRGYPLCAVLALVLVILAAVAIARFVHHLAIRWSDEHVPIIVHPGGYERVVNDLERALDDAGLAVDERPAPLLMALPGRLLGRIAGPGVRALVPDHPVRLVGPDLEVGLYPSDISIAGKKLSIARARAAIASRLTSTAASMTTSAEAQAVERKLEALTRRGQGMRTLSNLDPEGTLKEVDEALAVLNVPHDEWEILYRQRLQIERDLLAGNRPGSAMPGDGTVSQGMPASVTHRVGSRPIDVALALGTLGLIALDVVTALVDRRRSRG
jgi:hypothetical protein